MILNLSAHFACSGSSSPTSMPGTFVRIGRNSPRYSLGASGFRSYISMCGGPPGSQRKITDRSSWAVAVPACALQPKDIAERQTAQTERAELQSRATSNRARATSGSAVHRCISGGRAKRRDQPGGLAHDRRRQPF